MTRHLLLAALSAAALVACQSTPAPEPAAARLPPRPRPPQPPAPKAAIGDFGLDLAAGKPDVKAGDDFFAHVNGAWYDAFQIPEDRSSYGIFTTLDEEAQEQVRKIIEEAAASKPAAGLAGAEDRRLLRQLHGHGRHREPTT